MNDLFQKTFADSDSSGLNSIQLDASFFHESKSAFSNGEKYVVFCLGASYFAVSLKKVSEVVQRLSVTSLPGVPAWLLGIAELRGEVISVVSLQKLLGAPDGDVSSNTKFVVLKSPKFSSSVALAVDKLGEIVVLVNEEIQLVEDEKTPYLLGKSAYKSLHALNLIDTENLLASLTIC